MDTIRHRASRPKITKNAQSAVGTLRHSLRMTQAEFAAAMGVSVTTVSQWERGALTPSRTATLLMQLYARHPRLATEAGTADSKRKA